MSNTKTIFILDKMLNILKVPHMPFFSKIETFSDTDFIVKHELTASHFIQIIGNSIKSVSL